VTLPPDLDYARRPDAELQGDLLKGHGRPGDEFADALGKFWGECGGTVRRAVSLRRGAKGLSVVGQVVLKAVLQDSGIVLVVGL
jgi:hypothetical protein